MTPQALQDIPPKQPLDGGERHIVTALCYDLVDSTSLLETLGIEDYRDTITAFQRRAAQAIAAHGGELMTDTGDGGMAVFPDVVDPRDAASLAIHCGFAIIGCCAEVKQQQRLAALDVRIGIATSITLVQAGGGGSKPAKVTGIALAMAARLQAIAEPGSILVSQDTRSLAQRAHGFSDRGVQAVKGISTPQHLWRAEQRRRDIDRFFSFGRLSSPMVGREPDLARIAEVWRTAMAGTGRVLLIEGDAGVGKSRLVHRLRALTRGTRARLVLLQCTAGAAQSALNPLLQRLGPASPDDAAALVERAFLSLGIRDPAVIETFSLLLGSVLPQDAGLLPDPEAMRSRLAEAVRRAVQQLCEDGPAVLVVEDVHWIDPTTRSLLTNLSEVIGTLPLLLVLTSRNAEPVEWIEKGVLERHIVKALADRDVRRAIAAHLPESASAPEEMIELVARVSGGNPLFIEEMCQWLRTHAAGQENDAAAAVTPSTFDRVIEARLAEFGDAADVARLAAVVDGRFDSRLLAGLTPDGAEEGVAQALLQLYRAGILTQFRPAGAPLYGFRHALIQEAIYRMLLSKQRRDIHQAVYTLLRKNPGMAPGLELPRLATHAERAGLFAEATETFLQAGQDSAGRSALMEARQLLQHASGLCAGLASSATRDVLQLRVMSALGTVLVSTDGPRSEAARGLYDEGVALARKRPVAERARWFPLYWGWWFTGTEVNGERAHSVLAEMQGADDPEVQLQARHCVWAIDFYLGQHQSCIAAVDGGLPLYGIEENAAHSYHYGGHDTKVCGLVHRGLSLWFKGRIGQAIASLHDARHWAEQGRHAASMAHAAGNSAMFHCYRRDFAGLRKDIETIRALTGRHALPSLAAVADIFEGWSIGVEQDAWHGHALIAKGLAAHEALQTPEDYPVYAGLLAEVMVALDARREALALVESALATAEETGHFYWIAQLHRYRAILLVQTGAPPSEVLEAFRAACQSAIAQGATAILHAIRQSAAETPHAAALVDEFGPAIAALLETAEEGAVFCVNSAPLWRVSGGAA